MFQLFKRKYVYSPKQQTFKPLDAMPAHLPRQICSAFDDLRLIHTAGRALATCLMLNVSGISQQMHTCNSAADPVSCNTFTVPHCVLTRLTISVSLIDRLCVPQIQ